MEATGAAACDCVGIHPKGGREDAFVGAAGGVPVARLIPGLAPRAAAAVAVAADRDGGGRGGCGGVLAAPADPAGVGAGRAVSLGVHAARPRPR